jgi:hypothetical protein
MPPKAKATKGESWHEQGVRCQIYEKAGEPGVPELVKCGNEGWSKKQQFTVFVREGETAQAAVLRHQKFAAAVAYAREPEVGPGGDGSAEAAPGDGTEAPASDLFEPVEVLIAEVETLAGRDRRAPDRMAPDESLLRDKASSDARRWRKRSAEAAPHEEALCMKAACVTARVERDQACTERDQKVAELQQVRSQLLELAEQLGDADTGGRAVQVAARSFQVALMEILDGVDAEDEEQESSDEEQAVRNDGADR